MTVAGLWEPRFDQEPFEIEDVGCIHATDKALLCHLPDGEEEWFPCSQVWTESSVQEKGDIGTLAISPWLARKKNLLEDDDRDDEAERLWRD